MAKTKTPKETITPSDDTTAQAVAEGQTLIAEGKTKVEAAMAIYRYLNESPQDVVLQAFDDIAVPWNRRGDNFRTAVARANNGQINVTVSYRFAGPDVSVSLAPAREA